MIPDRRWRLFVECSVDIRADVDHCLLKRRQVRFYQVHNPPLEEETVIVYLCHLSAGRHDGCRHGDRAVAATGALGQAHHTGGEQVRVAHQRTAPGSRVLAPRVRTTFSDIITLLQQAPSLPFWIEVREGAKAAESCTSHTSNFQNEQAEIDHFSGNLLQVFKVTVLSRSTHRLALSFIVSPLSCGLG